MIKYVFFSLLAFLLIFKIISSANFGLNKNLQKNNFLYEFTDSLSDSDLQLRDSILKSFGEEPDFDYSVPVSNFQNAEEMYHDIFLESEDVYVFVKKKLNEKELLAICEKYKGITFMIAISFEDSIIIESQASLFRFVNGEMESYERNVEEIASLFLNENDENFSFVEPDFIHYDFRLSVDKLCE